MKVEIKSLYSPDVHDLRAFVPDAEKEFCVLITLLVGPANEKGEESFNVMVCNPKWIENHVKLKKVLMGRHYLIVNEYNYEELIIFIEDYIESCKGNSWQEVAERIGRLGMWEFEDYRENI